MRTLLISDLHLGGRLEHAVLTRPEPRRRLLAALDSVERLVLLGDTLELLEGRPHQAMQVAEPVLRELGTQLGPDREVIVVPGNHDALLIRGWARDLGAQLHLDARVPHAVTPALARMT